MTSSAGRPIAVETRQNIELLMQYLTHDSTLTGRSTFPAIAQGTGIKQSTVRRLLVGDSPYTILFKRDPLGNFELTGYMPDFPVDLSHAPIPIDKTQGFSRPASNTSNKDQEQEEKRKKYHVKYLTKPNLLEAALSYEFQQKIHRCLAAGRISMRGLPADHEFWDIINVARCLEVIYKVVDAYDSNIALEKLVDTPDAFLPLSQQLATSPAPVNTEATKLTPGGINWHAKITEQYKKGVRVDGYSDMMPAAEITLTWPNDLTEISRYIEKHANQFEVKLDDDRMLHSIRPKKAGE